MPSLFVRFYRKNRSEQTLFLFAYAVTACFSLIIAIVPKKYILKRIGVLGVESEVEISMVNKEMADHISKAIRRAVRFTPWNVTCLVKAVSAKYLLKRRRIVSTLYLGVAKEGSDKLTAHAWLRCGSKIVTGREEMQRFTTVAFFT